MGADAARRGAQPGTHRRERGGFAPTPEGWGRSGKPGGCGVWEGHPTSLHAGCSCSPAPGHPAPPPRGSPASREEWNDVSKTPERASGRESGRSDPRDPRDPRDSGFSTCQHFPFSLPPSSLLSWGREGGGTGAFLTGCGSLSPPGTPRAHLGEDPGVGGLGHSGTSKSPVSEGTHSWGSDVMNGGTDGTLSAPSG